MKLGFIGLGIMGSRMAANAQAAGHELVIHNRTRSKADDLIVKGATWAATPASVAEQVDVLITMLAHPEAIEETALGEGGFLKALPENALWVDCSTVNPSFSRRMAQAAADHHVRFIDAPVAGSKKQAADAQLVFLVGGAEHDIEQIRPVCEAMGRAINHVGSQGMGSSLKVVVNMLLATAMATFAEGMALGESLGISQETLLDLLVGGAVVAPFMASKKPKIESGDYEPDFPLQWMHKDLQMAALTAYETGVAMPVANASKELYQLALREGLGEIDFSAIYLYLKASKPAE
ncbi:MAG: NAD(P)-dependent oxidoreductase [Anaerolineae bacterium]